MMAEHICLNKKKRRFFFANCCLFWPAQIALTNKKIITSQAYFFSISKIYVIDFNASLPDYLVLPG